MAIKEMMETKKEVLGKNNLYLLLIILSFASCSQVRIHSPSSRYISPETAGKTLNGEIEIQQQVGTQGTISLEANEIDNPMKLSNTVSHIGTGINLGILEKIDFIGYGRTEGPPLYGVKVQLVGDSKINAKKGNFSVALTAGMGTSTSEFNDSSFLTNSKTTADAEQTLTDFSIIVGYRTDDDVLVYGSAQTNNHKVNLKISSSEASLDGKNLNLETQTFGLALGLIRYFESYMVKLETSAQQTDWTNSKKMTYGFAGLSIGKHW